MGILNVTPDSFSGDGVVDADDAVARAWKFVEDGADIWTSAANRLAQARNLSLPTKK